MSKKKSGMAPPTHVHVSAPARLSVWRFCRTSDVIRVSVIVHKQVSDHGSVDYSQTETCSRFHSTSPQSNDDRAAIRNRTKTTRVFPQTRRFGFPTILTFPLTVAFFFFLGRPVVKFPFASTPLVAPRPKQTKRKSKQKTALALT